MTVHLHGADQLTNKEVFNQLFRLRHHIFVEKRQWSLPSTDDMEIDQYDCPEAVYFFDQEDDGTISAHVRLTPTNKCSLLADYYPHLVENGADPRGDTIWECTRYIVRPSKRSAEKNRRTKSQLIAYMLEWCKSNRITHIQAVTDTLTFPTFVEMTSQTQPLGLSHPFGGGPGVPGGGECMAWRWPVTDEVIADIQRYGECDCNGDFSNCSACQTQQTALA